MKQQPPVLDEGVATRLREVCLRLPQTRETRTFGHLTLKVADKTFAVLERYNGRECITFKVEPTLQNMLVEQERFFIAPYVGRFGWVCIVTDNLNWTELESLLIGSYLLVASKRVATEYLRKK